MSDLIDFSSAGQTTYFRSLFPPNVPTSLVDIGAGNGIAPSNSRQLMIEGWSGLLIEPRQDLFAALETTYRGLPRATCLPLDLKQRQLSAVLQEYDVAPGFGALFVNTPDDEEVLQALDIHLFRPCLIVTADVPQQPEQRRRKYRRLMDSGYLFCGVVGPDSIWITRDADSPGPRSAPASIPQPLSDSPKTVSVPRCCLDAPASPIALGWGGVLPVEGWIIDPETPGHDTPMLIELADTETGATHYFAANRTPRPDVAAHFAEPHLLFCGFRAQVSVAMLRPAFYDLRLVLVHEKAIIARTAPLSRLQVTLHPFELAARSGLAARFLHGTGIEIGALQRALPLGLGCQVRYIDRMAVEDLIAHYPELAAFPIQPPDIIDDGELLQEIASTSQNFIVANHFFEHCQNPIRTLLNLARVLLPGGVLYMAVPDKRYTRDLPRPVTSYEVLRQAFLTHRRERPEVLFQEWAESWEGLSGESARGRGAQLMDRQYSIHYNVWALSDLLGFLLRAIDEFHLPFEITSVVSSENENILVLTKLSML